MAIQLISRERLHLPENLIGQLASDAALCGASVEPVTQSLHFGLTAFGAHRAAQFVGLGRGEAGDVDRDLHHLLLEHE